MTAQDALTPKTYSTRWIQLLLGLIVMMAISSPQYIWALFTNPLEEKLGVSLASIQVTFSILIVLQTFLSPIQGYLVDKFGPRILISAGAALSGLSWVLSAHVTTITGLYLTYGLFGGVGTGIVYIGCVGMMVRWFPDLRGFAVGMVAAGYGFGAVLTTFPVANHLKSVGLDQTLSLYGWILLVVGVVAALGMKMPNANQIPEVHQEQLSANIIHSVRDYSPREMLRTPIFWLMYFMMTLMSTCGLMVISQMGAFARDFGVADALVFGMAALPLALTLDRVTNGVTRPFFGWVSDNIGRENTMLIAFGLEGIFMTIWLIYAHHPMMFALLSAFVFFGWGEIFSLFPSTLTDTFGTKYASANYGFLYTSQGVGSILGGPIAALVFEWTQNWNIVFGIVIAMNFIAAGLAIFALKPMRVRRAENDQAALAGASAGV